MNARAFARELLPAVVVRALRTLGHADAPPARPVSRAYPTWDAAAAACQGYDAHDILARAEAATQLVLSGRAEFERDTVAFQQMEYPFAVLAGLLHAAAASQSAPFNVLDFGGSLGGTYRQCRAFLGGAARLQWAVVEQEHVARAGRARYANDELNFYGQIAEAATAHPPAVVLASSSIQYLRDPHAALAALARTSAHHFIIERTPLVDGKADRVVAQQVPPEIYPGSYPCWVLSRERVLQSIGPGWDVLADYACADAPLQTDFGDVAWRGLIFRRRP